MPSLKNYFILMGSFLRFAEAGGTEPIFNFGGFRGEGGTSGTTSTSARSAISAQIFFQVFVFTLLFFNKGDV